MNKIYRILRAASGQMVVASEVTRSCGKTASSVAFISSALISFSALADSSDVTVGGFNPFDNDNQVGAIVVGNGDIVNLSGVGKFQQGITGGSSITMEELLEGSRIVSGLEYVDPTDPRSKQVLLGSTKVLSYVDSATGNNKTISVYDSSRMLVSESNLKATASSWSNVNDAQYVDLRIGTVDASGGTLNVNIGDSSKGSTEKENNIVIVPKNSSLFYANGSGNSVSTVEWNSSAPTRIQFIGAVPPAQDGSSNIDLFNRPTYNSESFMVLDEIHRVSNERELAEYIDWLSAQASAGRFSTQKQYDDALNLAVKIGGQKLVYTNPITDADEIKEGFGRVAIINAVGANATGKIGKDARIDALNVGGFSADPNSYGAVLLAEQNGTVINDGRISVANSGGGRISTAMNVINGKGENNGIINAGFLAADGDLNSTQIEATAPYVGYAALVTGTDASFKNTGIINLAGNILDSSGAPALGVSLDKKAAGVNSGIINVGVSTHRSRAGMTGVSVSGESDFRNEGIIYIGRGPQYDVENPEEVADIIGNQSAASAKIYGVNAGASSSIVNSGLIAIGEKTQNAVAVNATGRASFTNNGTIDVKGALEGNVLENVGILVVGTDKVSNTGTINLTGSNGIGIKLAPISATRTAVTTTGTINVGAPEGGGFIANYGIWAEGAAAEAIISGGKVNLSGDRAIGVHSRGGGKIVVDGGRVDFVRGEDQIGFFAYGKDAGGKASIIDIKSSPAGDLVVKTAGSTLFRIEDGAEIIHSPGIKLTAAGEGSTALHASGVGSEAKLNTMNISVSGKNAVGVRVDGGATGNMSGMPGIVLTEDGATAVVVDNHKRALNGTEQASAPGVRSTFTNNTDSFEVSGAQNMTAFVVKNGAQLVNAGDIHVTHGTAIEIVGAGSSVVADTSGKRGTITVDDGVAGIHVHGGAALSTADTITVDNAAAGVFVGADAGRVVIEKGAHVTGKGSAFGNLITNQAAAGNTLVDGAMLEMAGSGAALLSENNLDATSHGNVIVSSNNGGKGIALSKADGGATSGNFNVGENWQIDVLGNGAGIYANTSGVLSVESSKITVSGAGQAIKSDAASLVSVGKTAVLTGAHADAQLIAGDMAQLYVGGVLNSVDANATAIALGASSTTAYITGSIVGKTDLGAGSDTVILEGARLDGTLHAGEGADTVMLKGPGPSSFTLLDGGVGADMDTLVFDNYSHTLDGGNVGHIANLENVSLTNTSTLDLRTTLALGDGGSGNGTLDVGTGSTLVAFNGPAAVQGHASNTGLIDLSNGAANNVLTVHGNYAGNGGVVRLDTVLGNDASPSDKLVVRGSTSGNTGLLVNNVGGVGAHTTADGIQVVQVDGASDGNFALQGRAVAGANEYLLAKGGKANPSDGDWYLRSEAPTPPQPPVDPKEPGVDPKESVIEEPSVEAPAASAPATPLYRPEVGAYLGNQFAASNMFMHTLHDRLGEVDFAERRRANGQGTTAGWARTQGRRITSEAGAGQIDMSTSSYVLQGGAELGRWNLDGDSRFHAGMMFGVGQATTDASSRITGYKATGKVDGYSAGVYGTWYQNASKPTGLYVDGWLQYGRYNNVVKGDMLVEEKYTSSTLSASIEAGYAFEVHNDGERAVYVEPQAQVVYTDYSASDYMEANGTLVRPGDAGGLQTRLGARVYTRPVDGAKNRLQPFVEVNWLHASEGNSVSMNGQVMAQDTPRDRFEFKAGAQMEFGKGWTGWASAGVQQGRNYNNVGGNIGVKYTW